MANEFWDESLVGEPDVLDLRDSLSCEHFIVQNSVSDFMLAQGGGIFSTNGCRN